MRIEILTTGDELTIGEILDRNAAWLGEQVFARGKRVARVVTVGDDLEEIVGALREGAARSDLLVVSGGLGPTLDDLTVDAVCAAFGGRPILVEAQLERIRERFRRLGRTFTKNNEKQALVPSGAVVLGNEMGTATAFSLAEGRCTLFCLPGVPSEFRPLVEEHVLPRIDGHLAQEGIFRCTRIVKCVGIPESHLDEAVRGLLEGHEAVRYGIRTHFPENHVRFVAEGRSEEEAHDRCETLREALLRRLGPVAYGGRDDTLASVTLDALRSRGWKLVLAESLTAGLTASMLAEVPGASDVLLGSSVVYSNELKGRWLGVVLSDEGPVSEACARQMAEGALAKSGADVSVALTGWAGPDGDGGPPGTVFAALSLRGAPTHVVRRHFAFGRNAVRKGAASLALDLLRRKALDLAP